MHHEKIIDVHETTSRRINNSEKVYEWMNERKVYEDKLNEKS